jgi:hypothetical protein
MILYNVTVSVDESVQAEWLEWMRSKHIPEVMSTGCFLESRISRIHGEEEGGVSFSIMYLSESQEQFDAYQAKHAPAMQADHAKHFGGHFAAFRTVLTVVEEFKYVG